MTERYNVTLHSPMGPRKGMLFLTLSGNLVTGSLTLLGYDNPVCGAKAADGVLRLTHLLRSDMRDLDCESEFHFMGDSLTGTARLAHEAMSWTGTLVCRTEKEGTD